MTGRRPRRPAVLTSPPLRLVLVLTLGLVALLLGVRTVDSLGHDVLVPTSWRAADTVGLVRGADQVLECAREGVWRSCGILPPGVLLPDYPEVEGSLVDRFPPLLYVPAVIVQGVGGDHALSLRVIGLLSLLSFGLLVALPWLVGRRASGLHRHRHLWALLILAGPLLPYAGSTWSEVPAAALLAAAVALVAAEASPLVVAPLALGAGLSKDTAPPLLLALAFAVAVGVGARSRRPARRDAGIGRWLPTSPAFVATVVASGAALALTAAFNVFRYGSLTNTTYLAATFQVRRPSAVAGHGIALLVSPNGGLFAFWPAAILLVVLACVAWRRAQGATRLGLAVVGITTTGFLLSLALWWAPFGWQAWSPRLAMPMVPAVAVAVLSLLPDQVHPGRVLLAAAAAAVVLALPQAGITGSSDAIPRFMNASRPACPAGARVEADFVRCNLDRAWRQQPPLLLEGLRGIPQPVAAPLSGALLVAGLALTGCWAAATAAPRGDLTKTAT